VHTFISTKALSEKIGLQDELISDLAHGQIARQWNSCIWSWTESRLLFIWDGHINRCYRKTYLSFPM